MSNAAQVLVELEKLGTAKNRKVYARHGINPPLFGVSYGHLRPLAKKLGTDHDVALALWDSGNHDARILAAMVSDADRLTPAQAESWIAACDNYVLMEAVTAAVSRSQVAHAVVGRWTRAPDEWRLSAGWGLVGYLASRVDEIDDAWFKPSLEVILRELPGAPNRARHAMNSALIAIGGYREGLRARTLEVAAALGKVEVDHGQTGCVTPDAAGYIAKMAARKADRPRGSKKKASKKKATKKKATKKKATKKASKKKAKPAKKKATKKKATKKKATKKKATKKKATKKKATKKKATKKKATKKKATKKKATKKKATKKKATKKKATKKKATKKKPAKKKPAKKKPAKKKPAKKKPAKKKAKRRA